MILPAAQPQHAPRRGVQDDGGITMPALDCDFIDRNDLDAVQLVLGRAESSGERALESIHILTHHKPGGDVFEGQHLPESRDLVRRLRGHPLVPDQPRHRLHPTPRSASHARAMR